MKPVKKALIAAGIAGSLFCSTLCTVKEPSISVDGKLLALSKETGAPINDSGTTIVPIRVISENLGYDVAWDSLTKTVTITQEGKTITLSTKQQGKGVSIVNSRTYVPLRYIAEHMGCTVEWRNEIKTVFIITKGSAKGTQAGTIKNTFKPSANGDLIISVYGDLNVSQEDHFNNAIIPNPSAKLSLVSASFEDESKKLLYIEAIGNVHQKRFLKMATIKDGAISSLEQSGSIDEVGKNTLLFSFDVSKELLEADSLLLFSASEAAHVPNVCKDAQVKSIVEYYLEGGR